MSDFQAIDMIWLIAALAVAVSALAARRVPASTMLRALVIWLVIGFVVFAIVQNRDRIESLFAAAGDRLGLSEQETVGRTVRIRMRPDGHFWARVRLNGIERDMLIDSGATITALSRATANAAGVRPDDAGFPAMIGTANGMVMAERGVVDSVALGPLSTRDLNVVVSEKFGDFDVLGMNFLSRLKSWRVEGNVLVLEPKGSNAGSNFT